jgi:hypothetical protein
MENKTLCAFILAVIILIYLADLSIKFLSKTTDLTRIKLFLIVDTIAMILGIILIILFKNQLF